MKSLSKSKMWLFAVGQLGWAMLSGLISNWLVYYYEPTETMLQSGSIMFIPQGRVILGLLTVVGAITAFGRIFDAVTDPLIASASDRCKSKQGRRIPFMKWASLPLALSTFLVFFSPVDAQSPWNAVFLFVMLMIYYLAITAYCTPYNALISELGHTQKQRLDISTCISFTFIFGTAIAYMAPTIWGMLEPAMGRTGAIRLTFGVMSVIAFVCMLVPVFTIKEKEYALPGVTEGSTFSSLKSTFKNRDFRLFVASDIFYWLGLTIFQTGLPFYITQLLELEESMSTVLFVAMTALSVVFYPLVNLLARKFGKKKIVMWAFALFTAVFTFTVFLGAPLSFNHTVQGVMIAVFAAPAMAAFGILPQAMVADIAESDSVTTGQRREGMFFAARTFAFKLGQSAALLLFTSIRTIGTGVTGFRLTAAVAAVLCLAGGLLLRKYNEKRIEQNLRK